jgi:hypothetical protein
MIQNEIRDRNHIHAVIDANDHDEAWAGSRVGLVGGKQLVASSKQRMVAGMAVESFDEDMETPYGFPSARRGGTTS